MKYVTVIGPAEAVRGWPAFCESVWQMNTLPYIARVRLSSVAAYRSMQALTDREKKHLLHEILQIRGLMPLLMKPRNRQLWTPEDREELKVHLRRLSGISPYLLVLALPGSFLLLPALAWWLDRRRNRLHAAVPVL